MAGAQIPGSVNEQRSEPAWTPSAFEAWFVNAAMDADVPSPHTGLPSPDADTNLPVGLRSHVG